MFLDVYMFVYALLILTINSGLILSKKGIVASPPPSLESVYSSRNRW